METTQPVQSEKLGLIQKVFLKLVALVVQFVRASLTYFEDRAKEDQLGYYPFDDGWKCSL